MTSRLFAVALGATGVASLTGIAAADFVGWTSTVRPVSGGYLVNVFAATNNSSDVLLNVFGGTPGQPSAGTITTGAPGGFRQADGALGVWAPPASGASQSWNTIDSFLTIGGSFNATTGEWTANGDSTGDPPWNVTYFDTALGQFITVNAFRTPSNSTGFTNPFINSIPRTGGVYIVGTSSPARSLASVASIRAESSSAAAAAAPFGILVGQFWVPISASSTVNVSNMGATIRRSDGTLSQGSFSLTVNTPVPPPDEDGDGVPDGSDNCPSVPNPGQADCNQNGIGEACESFADCNQNGVPDSCDIASGTSNDINANGIPDACEIDCDDNDIPDAFEIANGTTPDCNADGIPDTCQGAVVVSGDSGNLGAPSGAAVRSFTFTGLPLAADTVKLKLEFVGDLDGATEWADVSVGQLPAVRLFGPDGNDCPASPDTVTLTFPASAFNALIEVTGSLTVSIACPATVDATECKGNGSTELFLDYVGIGASGDCDGNRRLDVCDVASGGVPDCNGNGIPDSCDIAAGTAPDCNGNGVPDSCDVASGTAPDCNGNGIPDSCDLASGGSAVDCNGNGQLDSCELAANPSLDCNGNGQLDSCDLVVGGAAVDCNSNGLLDSCETAQNPAIDCNANGKPDSCDIASGLSQDIDGNGKPDECQTVQVPGSFSTIQSAINATSTSGEMRIIQLQPGTYTTSIQFLGRPVIIRGAGAGQTFIQPSTTGQAVVRIVGGPAIAALERVTVRNGTTGTVIPGQTIAFAGGGIYASGSPASIRDCTVEQNQSEYGGGIHMADCTGKVERCTVRGNVAQVNGGGIHLVRGSVQVVDSLVEGNTSANRGGGVAVVEGTSRLKGTTVRQNTSTSVAGGVSWAPSTNASASLVLEQCSVSSNVAVVAEGGVSTLASAGAVRLSFLGSNACGNLPRPNVAGDWIDLGGNTVCDCAGDVSGDGTVNGIDLGILLSSWGPCSAGSCLQADLDGSGIVDGADLGILLGGWGSCG